MRLTTRLAVTLGVVLTLPGIARALCAPEVTGIFPASGIVGTAVSATVRGGGLNGATVGVFGDPGLTVTTQASSDTALSLQITIDAAAPLGERILVIETAGGIAGASFTVNQVGGLVVDDVTPLPIATRGFGLDLALTGSRLDAVASSAVTVSGDGVTVTDVQPGGGGTTLDLSLDVAADATLGARAVEIMSSAGGAILQLVVQRPAPTLTSISPGAVEVGASVPLTVSGDDLTGAALVITGTGVSLGDVVTVDDETLTATVTVDGATSPSTEPRLLIVTTEAGQTTAELFIVTPGVPTVTTVRPGAGEPGSSNAVTLKGLNLTDTQSVTPDDGDLSVSNVVVVDDETVTLTIDVAPGAVTDLDHVMQLDTSTDMTTLGFRVIPTGEPFVGRVSPPFGNRGSLVEIRCDGVSLSTVIPDTGVDLSGPKILESNAEALDDNTVRALLDLDPTASVGFRDVTVTTSAGSFTADAAFRVNVPGQIPIVTDVQPIIVEPGALTGITVTGSDFFGGSALVTGPGATVTNVQVDQTGTIMTFDLVIDPAAPITTRAVIVVTENGTARCGIGLLIGGPELIAAKLVKTGALFTVATTGFRLLIFEFSMAPDFPDGPRSVVLTSPDDTQLVLTRQDVERIRRAFRDRPSGYVRATGVTATNIFGSSDPATIRR